MKALEKGVRCEDRNGFDKNLLLAKENFPEARSTYHIGAYATAYGNLAAASI
ncbi:MAG: hypothetical protein WA231_19270 [Methylocella sp.]